MCAETKSRRRHWRAALAMLLAAAVPPLPQGDWSCLETDRLRVYTDDSPKRLVELTKSLHRLDEVMGATGGLQAKRSRPAVLFAFRNNEVYERYAPRRSAGVFGGGEEALYLLIDLSAANIPVQTAHHEWTHLVLHDALPNLPPWFNEGYAEYLSTFESKGDRAELGLPDAGAVEIIGTEPRLLPLERLVRVRPGDPELRELGKMQRFYAQAWLFTHMLVQEPDPGVGDINVFVDLLRRHVQTDSAVVQAFPGIGANATDERLFAYSRQSGYKYSKWDFDRAIPTPEPAIRKVARSELLDGLGELLRQMGREEREFARAHWEEALRIDPKRASAAAGLGRLADEAGVALVADGFYRRAFDIDSTDARVLYRAAAGYMEREDATDSTRGWWTAAPASRRAALGWLDRVLEAHPDDAVARARFVLATVGNPDETMRGLSAARDAIAEFPFRPDLREAHALLYAQAGSTTQARRVLRTELQPIVGQSYLESVYGRVALVDLARAANELAEGRDAQADSVLMRAAAETDLPGARKKLNEARLDLFVDYARSLAGLGRDGDARAALDRIDASGFSEEQRKRLAEASAALPAAAGAPAAAAPPAPPQQGTASTTR